MEEMGFEEWCSLEPSFRIGIFFPVPGWLIFRLTDLKHVGFLKQVTQAVWNIAFCVCVVSGLFVGWLFLTRWDFKQRESRSEIHFSSQFSPQFFLISTYKHRCEIRTVAHCFRPNVCSPRPKLASWWTSKLVLPLGKNTYCSNVISEPTRT